MEDGDIDHNTQSHSSGYGHGSYSGFQGRRGCYNCSELNHSVAQCRHSQKTWCFSCKSLGHKKSSVTSTRPVAMMTGPLPLTTVYEVIDGVITLRQPSPSSGDSYKKLLDCVRIVSWNVNAWTSENSRCEILDHVKPDINV